MAGVQYLEPNRNYNLPIIFHSSLVFPGETVPMILSQNMFLSAMMTEFNEEGLLFGLICRELRNNSNLNLYGVTCQIYEKSSDDGDNVSIKSRAYQRFFIKNNEYGILKNRISFARILFFTFNSRHIPEFTVRNRTKYATVTILPEVVLPHPIYGDDSNSLSKFRSIEDIKCKIQNYQSKSLAWPEFVYRMYDVSEASKKIKDFLNTLKIGEPNHKRSHKSNLNL